MDTGQQGATWSENRGPGAWAWGRQRDPLGHSAWGTHQGLPGHMPGGSHGTCFLTGNLWCGAEVITTALGGRWWSRHWRRLGVGGMQGPPRGFTSFLRSGSASPSSVDLEFDMGTPQLRGTWPQAGPPPLPRAASQPPPVPSGHLAGLHVSQAGPGEGPGKAGPTRTAWRWAGAGPGASMWPNALQER